MIKKILSYIVILSLSWGSFPSAIGENGVVSSSSSYASDVGIEVLKDGGNAIDAAISVGFALAVTFPNAGNLGGGGFMVIRLASGEVTTIDFREMAPMLSQRDMFLDDSSRVIMGKSLYTALASGVPGTVAGFGYAHEKYGTKPWENLIEPAINLASNGFRLTTRDAKYLNTARNFLSRDKEASKIFGSSTIVVSIDVWKSAFGTYKVYSNRGQNSTGLDPIKFSKELDKRGVGELLITSILLSAHASINLTYHCPIVSAKRSSASDTQPGTILGSAGSRQELQHSKLPSLQ